MDSRIIQGVESSLEQAVGTNNREVQLGGVDYIEFLVQTGDQLPPWWSRTRDRELSRLWKANNHLSIAVYNAAAKIVGIPFRVVPNDMHNPYQVSQASRIQNMLQLASEFGQTWQVAYNKFIVDLLTQDNGAFMEIIGDGPADGPISGQPIAVRHLDSNRCQRTGNHEFPIVYYHTDGNKYKIHWTRLIMDTQLPSTNAQMYGVGFCAVSRTVEIARTLYDMIAYKQQRLGSRPHNQILVGKGITAKQIMAAMQAVSRSLDDRGLTHYSKTVAIGSENPEVGLERIDLTHMEPFDEEVSTNLGMFAIAAAFGMDADELWPVSGRSASQGDANLRRMRTRGRLPAQITQSMAYQFNYKFLPPYLTLEFDFKDDEEDMQRANIRDIRGRNRERDLGNGSITTRVSRIRMLQDNDIDRNLYEDMEITDGRLPDGRSIAFLFFDKDSVYSEYLQFMPDPLLFNENDYEESVAAIQKQRQILLQAYTDETVGVRREKMRIAYHALDWLEEQYGLAAGKLLPPVPVGHRSSRTDIRIQPAEEAPPAGEVSAAAVNMGNQSEDIPQVGA